MCVSAANLGFEFEYGSAIVGTPEDGGALNVASRIEHDPRDRAFAVRAALKRVENRL
jgi:hypothetical protein